MADYKLTIIVPVYNQEDLLQRALESIPKRDDIEILIVNDGSTDGTREIAEGFRAKRENVRIVDNPQNMGLGASKNVGYDNAMGEYVTQLDSDDYLYTDIYNEALKELDGTDMIYIDLRVNNGAIWKVRPETKHIWCGGPLRFIRRGFLGETRCPPIRAEEDWHLNEALLIKGPTEKFTGLVAYHYNWPRKGSLCDLKSRGLL